ncbi:indolepyruvate oxidoreductase subunit IorA [Desulfomarina profundi]|uniref:Indolepyruvate oxidoreductase subunit IorA n=1 Tax=Desulfomarina profundi TaxID=2772557 RepID=A0A8D5FRI4_9BACT|nr:indolepyruvate ferredoxin oxidoreductase subunit alpha [Desulfomarina profundi]BCL63059.1 indolepyruvate oxidoreductase subunit IorA [Desulfomarina profundi]
MKKILTGNEAVALGAYESDVRVASAYPGTPSTEILQNLAKYEGVYSEWAPNEKVAMEVAIGASMTGVRVLTTMKHVGLNVAADPLMTLAYTGIKGGFVVACADDPGMHSSQNEQDNRFYAKFAQIPMLEPSDSQEAREMVKEAFELSETFDTPAMVRLTTRISHSKGVVSTPDPSLRNSTTPKGFERDLKKFVMLPGHAKLRQPRLLDRVEKLQAISETTSFNRIEYNERKIGIITSGISYQYVKETMPSASILKLGMTFPLPVGKIRSFADEVTTLIVVEELEPYLEEQVRMLGLDVKGKEFFPTTDELSTDRVATGFARAGVLETAVPPVTPPPPEANMPRPPLMCAGCSHRGVFYAIKKLKGIVHGDIGCYTLGVLPPLQAIETCVCMGASISMAHGTAKAMEKDIKGDKRPVFAVIGDSTFFHTGINSLTNVVYNNSNVKVIILDNRITAMTGAQQNPGTGKTLQEEQTTAIDMEKLVTALGVKRVRIIDPYDLEETLAAMKEEASLDGPSVLITKRPCIQIMRGAPEKIFEVNGKNCIGCGMCQKLGCPAISLGDEITGGRKNGKTALKQSVIDPTLCTGCSLCEQVCKPGAIQEK